MTSTKVKWNNEQTFHLLKAMEGHRPFGLEKHFHMMFILEKFRTKSGLNVTSDALWDCIEEHYDINQLTERDLEKFRKNFSKSVDFSLPASFRS